MAKRRRPKKKYFTFDLSDFDFKLYLLALTSVAFGVFLIADWVLLSFVISIVLGLSGVAIGILYVLISNDHKKAKKHVI